MPANGNFSSIYLENRWNLAMDSYFSKDHVVEIDLETSRCVFRLPKTTTETRPQAYAPRRLGLGPYHHLRTDYKMQLHKISRVRLFLGPDKLQAFKQIVAGLEEHEPVVRACYDELLDFDIKTLARILAVDALYLLQLFDARKKGEISDEMMEEVAGDILTEENQIPAALFKVILQMQDISIPETCLSTGFRDFCRAYSPLELNETQPELMDEKQLHLLDLMYHSILTNRGDGFDEISVEMLTEAADNVTTIMGFIGKQKAAPSQILAIVERAKRIRDQLKGGGSGGGVGEEFASGPTALELRESAGVKFERSRGGIRDIMFYVDGSILQLPRIRLDGKSELALRNLVAYEAASTAAGATLELAEYVDLMCGLIRTKKDVEILKKAEIIAGGGLSEEEIVGVFEGIGGLVGDGRKRKSNVVEEVGKTNGGVGGGGKVMRFVKKSLSVVWRFLILATAVTVLAVLVMQAFCSVFVCGRWAGGRVAAKHIDFLRAEH